jgi:hypothetical protein
MGRSGQQVEATALMEEVAHGLVNGAGVEPWIKNAMARMAMEFYQAQGLVEESEKWGMLIVSEDASSTSLVDQPEAFPGQENVDAIWKVEGSKELSQK